MYIVLMWWISRNVKFLGSTFTCYIFYHTPVTQVVSSTCCNTSCYEDSEASTSESQESIKIYISWVGVHYLSLHNYLCWLSVMQWHSCKYNFIKAKSSFSWYIYFRFSRKSEAFASEFQENRKYMFLFNVYNSSEYRLAPHSLCQNHTSVHDICRNIIFIMIVDEERSIPQFSKGRTQHCTAQLRINIEGCNM